MKDRQLFRETFDTVKALDSLLERVLEQTVHQKHRSHRGMAGILAAVILAATLSASVLAV